MRLALRIAAALALTAAVAVSVALGALSLQHNRPVTLPQPSGPYAVGRIDFDWTDPSRVDVTAPSPGVARELTVWIWYPAAAAPALRPAGYMPPPLRVALERHMGPILKNLLSRNLSQVRAHALRGAPLSPAELRYPVLLLKPGLGALALEYTTLAEDLASHGYIVVASDSPHSTTVVVYRDSRIARRTAAGHPGEGAMTPTSQRIYDQLLGVWSGDESFLIDHLQRDPGMFANRLDLQTVGAFGHSFGGAAALRFCATDARCKGGVDLDGRLFGNPAIAKPFLFVLSDHTSEKGPEADEIRRGLRAVAARLPNRPALITLSRSRHFNFSDGAITKSAAVARIFGLLGPIDERRALAITCDVVRAFFDEHLKGRTDQVRRTIAKYPEIQIALE